MSPDVFVAFGAPKEPLRDTWKLWEEGVAPAFVLEVTSKSTQDEDEVGKKVVYEALGVSEYWQFHPTGDYLDPILKGHRLGPDGRYEKLDLEAPGRWPLRTLEGAGLGASDGRGSATAVRPGKGYLPADP